MSSFDTFANKIDQYLINLSFFSALSSQRWLKLSPFPADKYRDKSLIKSCTFWRTGIQENHQ
jgi:hypothetical protein